MSESHQAPPITYESEILLIFVFSTVPKTLTDSSGPGHANLAVVRAFVPVS